MWKMQIDWGKTKRIENSKDLNVNGNMNCETKRLIDCITYLKYPPSKNKTTLDIYK